MITSSYLVPDVNVTYLPPSEPKVPGCPYTDKIDRTKEGEEEASHVLPFEEGDDDPDPKGQLEVARQVFRNLEAFKEKVLRGSLQTKDCKLHFNSLSPDADKDVAASFDTNRAVLSACKTLLLELEASIEARYMKPPLKSHHPGLAPNTDEEVIF